MIFNSISLENFGIIKKFSKQFEKNILVLSGENGEGKSTCIKAILLAVFDDYEGVLSDYVNWESNYFQVIVAFSHKGICYESTVRYDGSSDRTLRYGDKVLKGEEAKKKLKEIIDIDLLKAGMLAMEQEIAIVKTKPAERREYLKRIYDIEFKRQLADLENDIKASELELAKKTTVMSEIEHREYTLPEKPELPCGKMEYTIIKSSLELERGKLHSAEESIRVYQQMQTEAQNLQRQSDKLLLGIKTISEEINRNKSMLAMLPESKKQAIGNEKAFLIKAEVELETLEEEFLKNKNEYTSDLDVIVFERLPVFNLDEFNTLHQELYLKKTKLTELESAKDVCPTCGQSISSPDHIAKRKVEISEITKQISELTAKFEIVSDKKNRRELAEKNNLEKTNRQRALQHELSLLEERNKSDTLRVQAKIDQSRNKLESLDAKFESEESGLVSLIDAVSANEKNLTTQLNDVQERLNEISHKLDNMTAVPQVDDIKATINKFETAIRQYDDASSRITEFERMERQIAVQKDNDLKQLEGVRTEIQVLNQLIGDWKAGIKILKTEFPVYVISRVIKDIEKSMNEFLKRTYPKYSVEVQDKKNALHIVYGPKKKDVSSASGFERQVFSLSFMYAVSHAIGNRCLILDECDSAATEKNSGTFYKVLGDSIGQGIDQIILISHKPSTRNILEFDYNAEVLTFREGVAV